MKKNYAFLVAFVLTGVFCVDLNAKHNQADKDNSQELEIKFFFPNLNVKQTVKCKVKNGKGIPGQKVIRAFDKLKKSLDLDEQYFLSLNGGKVLPINAYTAGDFNRNVIVLEDQVPVKLRNLPEKMQDEINRLDEKLKKIKEIVSEKFTDYYAMFKNPDLAVHGEKTIRALGQMYGKIEANVNSCLSSIKAIKD